MQQNIAKNVGLFILGVCGLISIWVNFSYSNNQPATLELASRLKGSKPLKTFSLTDTRGRTFTNNSLRGHWNLVYFGYTTCPSICPETLTVMQDTFALFRGHSPVRFIFTNITPMDDVKGELTPFLARYSTKFLGLAGKNNADITKFSKQLGVFAEPSEDGEIAHTSSLMLIDPKSRVQAVFTPPFDAQKIKDDLEILTR